MRSRLLLPTLIVASSACGNDGTAPKTEPTIQTAAVGTYSVFEIDGGRIPIVKVSQRDTACLDIESGGWFTLSAGGDYAMLVSRNSTVCNGAQAGAVYIAQRGTYVWQDDSVLMFRPTPPYGPAFSATFNRGTYRPGMSGTLPRLTFSFAGRDYIVLLDVPPES